MRVVVSYDISDTKRRNRVAKIMEGNGYRVQYSVFECELDARQLMTLQRRLRPLVKKEQGDSVRFYPLCADCAQRVLVIGNDLARQPRAVEVVG